MNEEKLPVLWDKKAEENLKDIYRYILENDAEEAAFNVWDRLIELAGTLGNNPQKFPIEPYLENEAEEYRSVAQWSYKLIYEVTDTSVIIVDVFHTSQHPKKIRKR